MTQSSEYPITARSYAFPRAALAGRHSASNMTQSIVIQGAAVGYAGTHQLVCTFGTLSYGALRIHCQPASYSDPAHILICKLPPSSLAPSLSRTIYCVCIYITVGQCGNQASHLELIAKTTDCRVQVVCVCVHLVSVLQIGCRFWDLALKEHSQHNKV